MHMIDKDAVLHMIDINIEPHAHDEWNSGYNVALSEMREKIKQMPTVEAQPVKNGMKLIDRDEVGAKIQAMYMRREIDYGGENEFCRGMRKALRIIEDAPTVEVQPDNGWISVDDRLPPYGERVLVINEAYGAEHRYTKYNIGVTVRSPHLDFTFWGHKVTHWQPLPKPPKEG